jgi:multiple sugar transport system ATP-binding protein
LKNVEKAYGEVKVLKDINLDIKTGELIVFVGPSGCGKSTLLRMIAGLERITGGDFSIDGVRMNDIPPAQRGIAMVFQSYALYPHMDLYENMAFGLKLAKVPKAEIDAAVQSAAKILHIENLLQRKPKDLSGGQRQRVAIGRAIVRKPEVFLFDEPLSNLDAALRMSMRYEFAKLHEELKTTMIYVTHDQVEAMTLADRIVVLQAGRIEQVGPPLELYEQPCNQFVAGFIGSPRMNFIEGTLVAVDTGAAVVSLLDGSRLRADVDASRARPGDKVTLGVRPEHLRPGAGDNAIQATVTFVDRLGGTSVAYFDFPGAAMSLTAELPGHAPHRQGDRVTLVAPAATCYLFDGAGLAFRRHASGAQQQAA